MAGYSGTPLIKKLGINQGARVLFVNPPEDFDDLLGPLPDDVKRLTSRSSDLDFIIIFARSQSELVEHFSKLASKLVPNGMLWVAWPKKSSGVPTDLFFEPVQMIGLSAGLVDVKVCAIDAIWSGLKFVIRVKDREKRVKDRGKEA